MEIPKATASNKLFTTSLLCSFSAVGLTCSLEALLRLGSGSDQELLPLAAALSSQLPALLSIGFGMAWVSVTIPSSLWTGIILVAALIQIPLTQYAAELFDKEFSSFSLCSTLIAAAILPKLLLPRISTTEVISPEPPKDFTKPRIRPAVTRSSPAPVLDHNLSDAVLNPTPVLAPGVSPASPVESPAVLKRPDSTPARVQASILHCELLNHAQLAQSLTAIEFTEMLNRLLGICTETSAARGARIDRADSESFRAFFTESKPTESHAESAVYTALALRTRLLALSEEWELKSGREIDLRIGVNTGEVVLSYFGPSKQQHLGIAGESAEWSRRLASANQLYGSKILISNNARLLAESAVELRPIDLLQRQLPPEPPEEVFELLALAGTLSPDAQTRLASYKEGFLHFRSRNWAAARQCLKSARPTLANDDAIDLLMHRINEQEALAGLVPDVH